MKLIRQNIKFSDAFWFKLPIPNITGIYSLHLGVTYADMMTDETDLIILRSFFYFSQSTHMA
jgi:hypothetical protein